MIKFKTDRVHKPVKIGGIYYYACNEAVGKLNSDQLRQKTNFTGKKITCKNCRKFFMGKKKEQKE